MSSARAFRAHPITRVAGEDTLAACEDMVAVEEPLEIRVGGRSLAVAMRTPGHDRELAAGLLVSEGLIRRRDDVLDMTFCDEAGGLSNGERGEPANVLDVVLAPEVAIDWSRLSRNVFASSSCGVCSKASVEAVRTQFPRLRAPLAPRREIMASLPEKLRVAQAGFAATGGSHASALFDEEGKLVVLREDVGRHNALDKAVGHQFFAERLPLEGHILLVSGRVSFEIVQKALGAGIPCVAAISAPTSAAVELAQASGQTLVGFLRGDRMNVYAGTLAW